VSDSGLWQAPEARRLLDAEKPWETWRRSRNDDVERTHGEAESGTVERNRERQFSQIAVNTQKKLKTITHEDGYILTCKVKRGKTTGRRAREPHSKRATKERRPKKARRAAVILCGRLMYHLLSQLSCAHPS
jgi:hypothetical protein